MGGFVESYIVFTICLCIYLYLRYKVFSYPIKQTKSYFTKRKENNCRFPPEVITFVFGDHTIRHLTGTALLLDTQCQSSSSFVCCCLPCSKISVSNSSPKWSWQWNLRRTVPNCPQLTPAIAVSVVPTTFGYNYINLRLLYTLLPLKLSYVMRANKIHTFYLNVLIEL